MIWIQRREFITLLGGAAAAWPLAARAQQIERMRRIGVLIASAEDDPETEAAPSGISAGPRKTRMVEGRNIHIDYRFAAGRGDQFPALAKELVAMQPDVILATHTWQPPSQYSARPARSRSYSSTSPTRSARASSRPCAAGRQSHRRATLRGDNSRQVASDAQGDCAAPHPCGAAGQPESDFLSVLPAIRRSHGARRWGSI